MSEEVKGKEVSSVNEDELAKALALSVQHQEKENGADGVKADYILLAKSGCKALKRSEKDLFIEGLAVGDIYIQKDKKNFGAELKVVPLAFVTLYNEMTGKDRDARFVGRWSKEQGSTFPTVNGNAFNHQLPNGNILVPVNWVMVNVVDHPEIENGVIAFKSTGSRIWRQWKEDAKKRAQTSATLVYTIKEETYNNKDYDWTDFGFEYTESLLETDKALALACLNKSNEIRESYENSNLIPKHDVSALSAKPVQAFIEDASDTEESYDDEEAGF